MYNVTMNLCSMRGGRSGALRPLVAIGVVVAVACVSTAWAQNCEPRWVPGESTPGSSSQVRDQTWWDPDGTGPSVSRLVVAGNGISTWVEDRWEPLPGVSATCVGTWDPDGLGPSPAQLVAGGSFTTASGQPANRVARWDGERWQPMGLGVSDQVNALMAWDPDGAGASPEVLIAAGRFVSAGGMSAQRVARWNGTQWAPLGSGIAGEVYALTTWDPDGDGPLGRLLVVGGYFANAGAVSTPYVAAWNGVAWSSLGSGVNELVRALATHDSDGPGPEPEVLVAVGNFTIAGGVEARRVATYSTAGWQPCGTGVPSPAWAVQSYDPDGPGPLVAEIVVGGLFTTVDGSPASHIAKWDGQAWSACGTGIDGDIFSFEVGSIDGVPWAAPTLVVGGLFTTAGGRASPNIARWNGAQWASHGEGFATDARVRSVAVWDDDGPGPQPPQLVVSGYFTQVAGGLANHVARWDGRTWSAMGTGLPTQAYGMVTWDPDGGGPQGACLVAGGYSPGLYGYVKRWNGVQWVSLMEGSSIYNVWDVSIWDPDGSGPLAESLVACGSFATGLGLSVRNVGLWNGAAWQSLGAGLSGTVYGLTSWDPDGTGLAPNLLVACGQFSIAPSGQNAFQVAAWNGTTWSTVGGSFNENVYATALWDADGEGPGVARLVACGNFTMAGGVPASRVAVWSGTAWEAIGAGFNDYVFALSMWDPDGDGSSGPCLIAGGNFTQSGVASVPGAAQWNGEQWVPIGAGLSASVRAFVEWSGQNDHAPLPELISGGLVYASGSGIARWIRRTVPWTVLPIRDVQVGFGQDVVVPAAAARGYASMTVAGTQYRWQRNGVDVSNGAGGASVGGGMVSGAHGPITQEPWLELAILNASDSDSGEYRVVMTSECGVTVSDPVMVVVGPLCSGDVNCDMQPDGTDVLTQELAVGGDMTDYCQPDADFNRDFALDGFDVEAVELVVGGGPCP